MQQLTAEKVATLFHDANGDGMPSPGDTLEYTIAISNVAETAATGVVLEDVPDTNTTLVIGSVRTNAGTVISGNQTGDTTVVVMVGTISGSGSVSVRFEVRINNPPLGASTVTNQARITGDNFQPLQTDDPTTAQTGDPTLTNLAGRISGTVFLDDNGDGVQNLNEPGIVGVTVELIDPTTAAVLATTTTTLNGTYMFSAVTTGQYAVRRSGPPGYVGTTADTVPVFVSVGGSTTANFGVEPSGRTETPTLTATPSPIATATPTATPRATKTSNPIGAATDTPTATSASATPTPSAKRTQTPPWCIGDCNGDGEVSIDELITVVNIALGTTPFVECPAGDGNGDGDITIDEILTAVNAALHGCGPQVTPTPTPTFAMAFTPTAELTPSPSATALHTVTPVGSMTALPSPTATPSPRTPTPTTRSTPTITFTHPPTPTVTPTATEAKVPTRTPTGTPAPAGGPDLAIRKFRLQFLTAGRLGWYFISVKNVGTAPTEEPIIVTDNLPPGLTLLSVVGAGWDCTATVASHVICTHRSSLAPADSLPTIGIEVQVDGPAGARITNTAAVSTPDDHNPSNDRTSDTTNLKAPC